MPPAPSAAASSGWLGGGGDNASSPTVSVENSADTSWGGAPSAKTSSADLPALELPENTIPVDLGTPWEDGDSGQKTNKLANVMLGSLVGVVVVGLSFVGYNMHKVKTQPLPPPTTSSTPNTTVGDTLLGEVPRNLKNKEYSNAARNVNDAYQFYSKSEGIPEKKLKEVQALRRSVNLQLAEHNLSDAEKALKNRDYNSAISLGQQAEGLFRDFNASGDKIKRAKSVQEKSHNKVLDARKGSPPTEPVVENTPEPMETPTLGEDGPNAPQGRRVGGRGPARPNTPVGPAQPQPQQAKPRPQPQPYQPPRHVEQPRAGQRQAPAGYY